MIGAGTLVTCDAIQKPNARVPSTPGNGAPRLTAEMRLRDYSVIPFEGSSTDWFERSRSTPTSSIAAVSSGGDLRISLPEKTRVGMLDR